MGKRSKSTLFVSCTATRGATIFRVPRNKRFLKAARRFTKRFKSMFVMTRQEPPVDYFSEEAGYMKFLLDTRKFSANVPILLRIEPNDIQRSPYNDRFFLEMHSPASTTRKEGEESEGCRQQRRDSGNNLS